MSQQYDIRILMRSDTADNWDAQNPTLRVAEMGYAFVDGEVYGVKVGINKPWSDTPWFMLAFAPINTSYGRDLDNPGGTRNKYWNITDLNTAMQEVFNPYSPPSIAISSPSSFPVQEVGVTYATSQAFNIAIGNALNVKKESGIKKLYVNGTAQDLSNQVLAAVNETVTKNISANMTVSGSQTVLSVNVLRSDNSVAVSTSIGVTFYYRSGYFLWPASDDLMAKTDAQITTIIQSLGSDVTGVKHSSLNYNGGKSFGTVGFDSTPAGSGLYNVYVFYPTAAGTATIAPDAFRTSPVGVNHRTFNYVKAAATTNYKISKMVDPIQGGYSAFIQ